MRDGGVLLLGLAILIGFRSECSGGEGPRYAVERDLKSFPQATPQEALASILKAIDLNRFDYLVAQLADPTFIDPRVRRLYGGRIEPQIEDTRARLDPFTIKLLRRFCKEGVCQIDKQTALVRLKDVSDRCVYLSVQNGRWFLEHRFQPPQGKQPSSLTADE
jgi:hypothetical protein